MPRQPPKKTGTRPKSTVMTSVQREQLYADILQHHVINGMTYRETAETVGIDLSTLVYHTRNIRNRPTSGGFLVWMKLRHPERYDREFIVQRFIDRSEQRRKDALYEFLKHNDTAARLKAIKEIREEDLAQLKLLQDVGVVEAKSEQHAQVPVVFTWGAPGETVPVDKKA